MPTSRGETGDFPLIFLGFFLYLKRDASPEQAGPSGGVEPFSFFFSDLFSVLSPIISPTKIPQKAKHIKGFNSDIASCFHSITTTIRTFTQAFSPIFFSDDLFLSPILSLLIPCLSPLLCQPSRADLFCLFDPDFLCSVPVFRLLHMQTYFTFGFRLERVERGCEALGE